MESKPPKGSHGEGHVTELLHELADRLHLNSDSFRNTAKAGRERIERVSAKRDLDRLLWKLGKEVVALVEAGEIDHPGVKERVARILRHGERVGE